MNGSTENGTTHTLNETALNGTQDLNGTESQNGTSNGTMNLMANNNGLNNGSSNRIPEQEAEPYDFLRQVYQYLVEKAKDNIRDET